MTKFHTKLLLMDETLDIENKYLIFEISFFLKITTFLKSETFKIHSSLESNLYMATIKLTLLLKFFSWKFFPGNRRLVQ